VSKNYSYLKINTGSHYGLPPTFVLPPRIGQISSFFGVFSTFLGKYFGGAKILVDVNIGVFFEKTGFFIFQLIVEGFFLQKTVNVNLVFVLEAG